MKAVQMAKAGFMPGISVNGESVVNGKEKNAEKNGKGMGNAIYAGNLEGMNGDRIEKRRNQARKQAGRMIMDQFAADSVLTDTIKENREKIRALQAECSELMDQVKDCENRQTALKETYGITDDSVEQKDLELIQKAKKCMKEKKNLSDLSEEELDRLQNMGPLTEYQERALWFDEIMESYDTQINALQEEIYQRGQENSNIRQGMLKQRGMTDAKKASDQILDAASKDIIGMMMQDAKKHVDEEMAKLIEAAKEAAEKKKAEEEKKEKAEAAEEEQEELTEEIQEGVSEGDEIQQEVNKILDEAKLLLEERKGLVVSEQV